MGLENSLGLVGPPFLAMKVFFSVYMGRLLVRAVTIESSLDEIY